MILYCDKVFFICISSRVLQRNNISNDLFDTKSPKCFWNASKGFLLKKSAIYKACRIPRVSRRQSVSVNRDINILEAWVRPGSKRADKMLTQRMESSEKRSTELFEDQRFIEDSWRRKGTKNRIRRKIRKQQMIRTQRANVWSALLPSPRVEAVLETTRQVMEKRSQRICGKDGG